MKLITKTFRDLGCIVAGGAFLLSLASCGGGGGSPGTVAGGSTTTSSSVGSVSLTFSATELKSAGVAGSEVTVTALVKSANNTALADIPVSFTADSGALAVQDSASDKNGQAKALLSTSGDRTNRKITVSASAGGKTTSGSVDVVGTSVSVAGAAAISSGSSTDFTVTVKDSANAPIANVPVTISSQQGNPIAVKTSNGGSASAPLTNSQGQVVVTVTGQKSGTDILTIASQGVVTTSSVTVNAAKLTVSVVDGSGNSVTTANTTTSCQRVLAHYEISGVAQNGTVNISTSRGQLYSNSTCQTALTSSSVALVGGDSQPVYLKSNNAGVATVSAAVVGGPTAQTDIEFIAALTSSATISLQAEPAIIGTNTGTGTSERSTLTAIVRDGTTFNNLVKNAVVEFSLLTDKSGGSLSTPSTVTTASNGTASVVFIAGTADTSKDGVLVQAKIQGTSITTTTTLTVSKKSLFISAGTGNKLATPNDTTYEQDYTVFVTDASGNPVPNVPVTASVFPTAYFKGAYRYDDVTAKAWTLNGTNAYTAAYTCTNEDVNQDGILDSGEDFNSNGILDPGIPVTITPSATTDATGTAKIALVYPRDRAAWLSVKISLRASVSGTESTYQIAPFILPVLSKDLSDQTVSPPGAISPYGTNPCNIAN